jgi:branched-subunit amino acid aminotransferase/4-amino-4-deoxychorismate lyase
MIHLETAVPKLQEDELKTADVAMCSTARPPVEVVEISRAEVEPPIAPAV